MLFTKSRQILTFALVSTFALSACSKESDTKNQDTLVASTPATGEASTLTERNAQQRLVNALQQQFKQANINAKINSIKATEVPNIYWVNLEGMGSVYTTSDGKYIIQGDIIRLGDKTPKNIGSDLQAAENKKLFAALKPEDLIIYPSTTGKTKHVIYVFTDSSCPYCHKLHEHLSEINADGIEVRYIAWPRGEQFLPTMEAIWCSADRKAAFSASVKGEQVHAASCKNPVKEQYQLGTTIGVNGTPAIYNADGQYIGGYLTPNELVKLLEK